MQVDSTTIPVGTRFHGHCKGFDHYFKAAANKVWLQATCKGTFFLGGKPLKLTVYLQADLIDNGVPGGHNDIARIAWGFAPYPGCCNGNQGTTFIYDSGKIRHGNIRVVS